MRLGGCETWVLGLAEMIGRARRIGLDRRIRSPRARGRTRIGTCPQECSTLSAVALHRHEIVWLLAREPVPHDWPEEPWGIRI
jgi:hypothetical protein